MKRHIREAIDRAPKYVTREYILARLERKKAAKPERQQKARGRGVQRPITPDGHMACSKCGRELPLSEFYMHRSSNRSHYDSRCHECRKIGMRARRVGISFEEYQRLFSLTNGQCSICHVQTGPYIDHCHQTMKVRGLLCPRCNAGLGQFGDSIELLKEAIAYLQKHEPKQPPLQGVFPLCDLKSLES